MHGFVVFVLLYVYTTRLVLNHPELPECPGPARPEISIDVCKRVVNMLCICICMVDMLVYMYVYTDTHKKISESLLT
jgi:hypothetical protein